MGRSSSITEQISLPARCTAAAGSLPGPLVPSQFLRQWLGGGVKGWLGAWLDPRVSLGRFSCRPGLAKVQNDFSCLIVPEKPQEAKVNIFLNNHLTFPLSFSFTFSHSTFPLFVTLWLLPEWAKRSTRHQDKLEFQLHSYSTTKITVLV